MIDLTFVLCSRNDRYQGDAVWRLSTALNYLGFQAQGTGLASCIEVLVSDWGSERPLRSSVRLTPEAAALTRFVEVPPALAKRLQGDSPFSEVLANNAAIRRASGRFVGRIDQDTLVGGPFLQGFLELADPDSGTGAERRRRLARPLERSFLFIGRRAIPVGYAATCPDLAEVIAYVHRFRGRLPRDGRGQRPWYDAPVGVLLMARELWGEYGGYDESLRYWGFMETDLGLRTAARDGHLDLESTLGGHFFHLGHTVRRVRKTKRRRNPRRLPRTLHPNAESWGLASHDLDVTQAEPTVPTPDPERAPTIGPARAWEVTAEWTVENALTWGRRLRSAVRGDRLETPPRPPRLEEPPLPRVYSLAGRARSRSGG